MLSLFTYLEAECCIMKNIVINIVEQMILQYIQKKELLFVGRNTLLYFCKSI